VYLGILFCATLLKFDSRIFGKGVLTGIEVGANLNVIYLN
jgi:hypothetical protein